MTNATNVTTNTTTEPTRFSLYVQKGDLRGWVSDFKCPYPPPDITPGGVLPPPEIQTTTDLLASKVFLLDAYAKYVLNWLYKNGYVLRVCGKIDRTLWLKAAPGTIVD